MKVSLKQLLKGRAEDIAPRLLGCELVRKLDGQEIRLKIVETESYHESDTASHSYKGKTPRTEVMFGPAGTLYVYFTYGMHYCCNIVTGEEGEGSAVLIRALEPLSDADILVKNRANKSGVGLTNGPAKLCQALGIDLSLNGHDLENEPLSLILHDPLPKSEIIQATRIGISQAQDKLWRFYIKDNQYVSKK